MTGTDTEDMSRLGRPERLKRSLNGLAIFGFTLTLMGTWVSTIASSEFSLINGGRAGSIWEFMASWILMMTVTASLAEMVSMAPSSAGQYHWVSEFAPPGMQKTLSYISGWLAALGWQGFVAFTAFQAGQLILIAISIPWNEYSPSPWQATLAMLAIVVISTIINVIGIEQLRIFESMALVSFVVGFFLVLIVLWNSPQKASSLEIFLRVEDFGGWKSPGLACFVGQLASVGALLGSDAPAHMAEEVINASWVVPWMMMGSVFVSGLSGFGMLVMFVSRIDDVRTQIVDSTAVYPFVDVLLLATGDQASTLVALAAIIFLGICSCVNSQATASRQAFAFAGDGGLPKLFGQTMRFGSAPLPLKSIIISPGLSMVIALMNLAGTEVFDSIAGLTTGAVLMTYCLSIGSLFCRRLCGSPLPHARWSLGRWGIVVNGIALIYVLQSIAFSFFPLFPDPSARSMNWSIAVFGAVALFSTLMYVKYGRKAYISPVVHVVGTNQVELEVNC